VQKVLGCFQERLADSEEPMENITGEKEMKKKCPTCGEVKSLTDYYKCKSRKDGHHSQCRNCMNEGITKYRNTEKGYLKHKYNNMNRNFKTHKGRYNRRHFTFDELWIAFKKHKNIYGMKSIWGPGIDYLEQHISMTMIVPGKIGGRRAKRIGSNLSIDRLDSNRDYTLQNIIFICGDENVRKKDTSYEDCKIQIRLHEERF